MQAYFILDEPRTPQHVMAALGDLPLVAEPAHRVHITYLDTFDWRVHNAGARLWEERRARERALRWQPASGGRCYELQSPTCVQFAHDLPPGWLRTRLESLLDVRALLTLGEARVERQLLRLVDVDGNTTARLWKENITPLDAEGAPDATLSRFRVEGLTGHERELAHALARLHRLPGVTPDAGDDLERAVTCRGRRPGDYSSKLLLKLEPEQRSDAAMTTILLHLLETVGRNVRGVIDDHDSEFLHDLRVACRRTRSALTQLKGVLPDRELRAFADEFRWLGTLTGPCRDLDVYLLEMHTYRRMLPGHAARELEPLEELITAARTRAHRDTVRGLQSDRFAHLVESWRAYLGADRHDSVEPHSARPVRELAGERILKAYRRIVKKGRRLGQDPQAAPLHRLRIDAKKLRYLLEFFRSLYPPRPVDGLIKELKRLQDILGGFNDMAVQQDRLQGLAQELLESGAGHAGTYLALGRLEVALETRQEEFRQQFHHGFVQFANQASHALYHSLFGGPGGRLA